MKKFLIFALALLLIGTVAAAEWDNVKSYDAETKTITITNLFGLGDVIATYRLVENTDQCLFNCYAIIETVLFENGILASDIEFRNMVGDTQEINDFKYFTLVEDNKDVEVPTYIEQCIDQNGSGVVCNMIQNGTTTKEVITYDWRRYFGTELPAGVYRWKIEGRKGSESIDWVISAFGKTLDDWAWWNSTFTEKRRINVTNNNNSILTNFEHAFNITYDSDMHPDFSDLRFTDQNDSYEFDYYLEVKEDSSWAYVWVEFPTEDASSNNATYMYYGNSSIVISQSSGTNTFRLFEDFDSYTTGNTSFPVGGWTTAVGLGAVDINSTIFWGASGKSMSLSTIAGGGAHTIAMKAFPVGVVPYGRIRLRYYSSSTSAPAQIAIANSTDSTWDGRVLVPRDGNWKSFDGLEKDYLVPVSFNEWNLVEMVFAPNLTHTDSVNGSVVGSDGSNDADLNGLVKFTRHTASGVSNFDNIIVTQYIDQMPTYAIGLGEIPVSITTNLVSPVNNYNSSVNWIEFIWNSNVSGSTTLTNTTFYAWNSSLDLVNSTFFEITGTENQTTLNFTSIPQENYTWNAISSVADPLATIINDTNRTFDVHLTSPNLTITYPTPIITLLSNGESVVLNWTISDSGLNLSQHINNCSYVYNGIRTDLSIATCVETNATTFTYVSGINTISMNATDIFGFQTINSSTWVVLVQALNQSFYNSTGVSYYNEQWSSTFNSSADVVTANLWFNGTSYPATVSNISKRFNVTINFTIPDSFVGANTFHWQVIADGTKSNTTSQTQNFTGFNFGLCNSSLYTKYINLTFINETVLKESINASIVSSSWAYYGSNSSKFKSLSFVNATENPSYDFCGESTNRTIKINTTLNYDNSISEQRTFTLPNFLSFTNVSTNYSLYLLPTSEGVFVTFQLLDQADQVISGVLGNVSKSGNFISTGFTDDAGILTFFLDPDSTYKFTFSKTGHQTYTSTFQPTQLTYTITLGGASVSTSSGDFTKGMEYYVYPPVMNYSSPGRSLTNNTNTQFNFTIDSSFWTITEYGFAMYNSSGHNLNSTKAFSNGGTLSLYVDTLNDSLMVMNYYWIVTGNITNGTLSWTIFDSTGTGYGVKNLVERTRTYFTAGIFGSDNNLDLAIFAFIAIFLATGVISYKFGVTSSQLISAILFGLVMLFDIGFGLFGKQGLATVMIGIISIAVWIKEGTQ